MNRLDEWLTAVAAELGVSLAPGAGLDTDAVLALTRDVAHGVARPAAPLTALLVGIAAGQAGGGPQALADAVRSTAVLTERWTDEHGGDSPPDGGGG